MSGSALSGDYKKRYKQTRDKMLQRPTTGSHELLKLRYAQVKKNTTDVKWESGQVV